MYDFHKHKVKGTNWQVFKHAFFIKGKRHLLPQIKRKSNSSHPHKIIKEKMKDSPDVHPPAQGKRAKKITEKSIASEMAIIEKNMQNENYQNIIFNANKKHALPLNINT